MRLRRLFLSTAVLATVAVPAFADSITATLQGPNLAYYENVNIKETSGFVNNEETGEFLWKRAPSTYTPASDNNFDTTQIAYSSNFYTYCIDLTNSVSFGQTVTFDVATLDSFLGSARADAIRVLYAQESGADVGAGLSNINSAAFQLAVWEIVKDDLPGTDSLAAATTALTSNLFYATSSNGGATSAIAQAAQYLYDIRHTQTLGTFGLLASSQSLDAFVARGSQTQVFMLSNSNIPGVPLPGAAAAAVPILMLGGTTLKSKRRRRQAEESAL